MSDEVVECSEDGCTKYPHARGFCQAHYRQVRRRERGLKKPGPKPRKKHVVEDHVPKTHCPQEHAYTEENTYVDKNGGRHCRTCRRERKRLADSEGVGRGGRNAVKTHCPQNHEYTEENTYRNSAGRRWCRTCMRRNASSQVIKKFGITKERFDTLRAEQGNACGVCKTPFTDTPRIDHDHACCPGRKACGSCVRGLLCNNCNTILGLASDSPDLLRAAADYLG